MTCSSTGRSNRKWWCVAVGRPRAETRPHTPQAPSSPRPPGRSGHDTPAQLWRFVYRTMCGRAAARIGPPAGAAARTPERARIAPGSMAGSTKPESYGSDLASKLATYDRHRAGISGDRGGGIGRSRPSALHVDTAKAVEHTEQFSINLTKPAVTPARGPPIHLIRGVAHDRP